MNIFFKIKGKILEKYLKCNILWLTRDMRVHLDLYAPDIPKNTPWYDLHPSDLLVETPCLGASHLSHTYLKNIYIFCQ